jgi:hypothetical protein
MRHGTSQIAFVVEAARYSSNCPPRNDLMNENHTPLHAGVIRAPDVKPKVDFIEIVMEREWDAEYSSF